MGPVKKPSIRIRVGTFADGQRKYDMVVFTNLPMGSFASRSV